MDQELNFVKLKMQDWFLTFLKCEKKSYCIEFNIKPALTNEELIEFNVSERN